MSTEVLLGIAASLISLLIGLVGYLVNRQLTKIDDKVAKMDSEFFEVKSNVIDISNKPTINQASLIAMLESEVLPNLKIKGLEDKLMDLKTEITIMREYQKKIIAPSLDRVSVFSDKIERIDGKQKNSDEITLKMFEVVKRLVEKK